MLFRLLIFLLTILLVFYYLCVVLHIIGAIKISKSATQKDPKLLIPLYYFFKN
jgi:hypothetical protein